MGVTSPGSHYDVRFLFVHRPEWHLHVESRRDVIWLSIDDELEICGWECIRHWPVEDANLTQIECGITLLSVRKMKRCHRHDF